MSVIKTYSVHSNFHRPCFFPKPLLTGRTKIPSDCMITLYDKLKPVANAKTYLKPDIAFEVLDKVAIRQTDDQAAEQLQKERSKLFKTVNEQKAELPEIIPSFRLFIYWKILW